MLSAKCLVVNETLHTDLDVCSMLWKFRRWELGSNLLALENLSWRGWSSSARNVEDGLNDMHRPHMVRFNFARCRFRKRFPPDWRYLRTEPVLASKPVSISRNRSSNVLASDHICVSYLRPPRLHWHTSCGYCCLHTISVASEIDYVRSIATIRTANWADIIWKKRTIAPKHVARRKAQRYLLKCRLVTIVSQTWPR